VEEATSRTNDWADQRSEVLSDKPDKTRVINGDDVQASVYMDIAITSSRQACIRTLPINILNYKCSNDTGTSGFQNRLT